MAKGKGGGDARKISFGKRKEGKASKSANRHNHKEKNYRGQGR